MKNIIESIVFEIRRSKLLPGLSICLTVILVVMSALSMGDDLTSGLYLGSSSITFMFPVFIVGAVVGIVCCSDMKDKVANYEILSGHSREQFYFARFILSVFPASILAFALSFVPMIFGKIFYGWGDKLVFSEVLTRQLLYIFPFLRLAAFFVCISFLVRNDLIMIAVSFGMSILAPILFTFFPDASKSVFISIYNFNYLMDFHVWEIYNVSAEGILKYKTGTSAIEPGMITGTITISLVMTLVYMILGYGLFKRSDID